MISQNDIVDATIQASFGGVPFWMPDGRITAGRRVQRWLFPGRDDRVYEDLGVLDGPLQISGLIVGDDYVSVAQDMRDAMRSPGPTTLLHPWLGELLVILVEPGTISFDVRSLRVARLEMTVELYTSGTPQPPDTLAAVNDDISDVQQQANDLVAGAVVVGTLTIAAVSIAEGVCSQVASVFSDVLVGAGAIASAASASVAALGQVTALALDGGYAAALTELLTGPATAIAATSQTLVQAAIGPGDEATLPTAQDPRITTQLLLDAAAAIVPLASVTPAAPLALATAALTLSSAIDASTDIAYTSQKDAETWLASLLAGIDGVANLAVQVAPSVPAAAGPVWRSLQRLRAAVAADINAQIGRLPIVQDYTLIATMPAWLVAQALAGDTPGNVLAMYTDLVARNAVANPAMMGPGTIEALVA